MFVHPSRILKQFQYLQSLGIDTGMLADLLDIKGEEALSGDSPLDFDHYLQVLEFALRQTANPEYGLDFGSQPQIGGTIGMLCASCSNLREAFIQGCKFLKLQGDFAELIFVDDERLPRLVYTPLASWALEHPQQAKLEVDAMFAFLNTIVRVNSNDRLSAARVRMTCPVPANPQKYEAVFRCMPHFAAEANELVFEQHVLNIPMKAFNPETQTLLGAHLESQLSKLGRERSMSDRVRQILHASFQYNFPDMESVAGSLNMSTRTLQRRLAEEQVTFQAVVREVRCGIARKLLEQGSLSISELAFTLGYADLPGFSRSFKKYCGQSPQAYRSSVTPEQAVTK